MLDEKLVLLLLERLFVIPIPPPDVDFLHVFEESLTGVDFIEFLAGLVEFIEYLEPDVSELELEVVGFGHEADSVSELVRQG